MRAPLTYFISWTLITINLWLSACSADEPEPINEEEVITTMTVTLNPEDGGTAVILQTRDLDGDGPNAPVITVSDDMEADTKYSGSIELLNETVLPPEDITEEVKSEGDEHQFFFQPGGGINIITSYSDQDQQGNPIGLEFQLTSGETSAGNITIVLRHEPNKDAPGVSDGDISQAGGNTDISQSFPIAIK